MPRTVHRSLLSEYIRLVLHEGEDVFLSDVTGLLSQHGISVGKFLGQGLHGAAFEFGHDRVIKISVAKDEAAASGHVRMLRTLQQKNSPALAAIYDAGVLGPVQLSGSRWVNKEGIAFYYVMERVFELPADEARLAVRLLNELVSAPGDAKKIAFVARRTFKRDGDDVEIVERVLRIFQGLESSGVYHRDINVGALMANKAGEYRLVDMESARMRDLTAA